ncbi:uncharacterized protein STEHIDRAFT_89777 [Stereum hirsutum FP-91666 SS1]|uniref:uncharacterized protein n=1 Tax=Stereum hirsutum (strain FP-91666) TaxID=721885 RepID=UPI000440F32A|nr:uncharacterized protein STEHIDRAFT_89777 [Stereum hirsutum FP-91666 SS1]EIM92618.1 hypothetical protein STEHIDRAFT_89777 [Stereum hirsutum FP-91666 SS1]
MQMGEGSWEDRLHISFIGEHVLFPGLRLDSWGHFVGASLLTTTFCLCERLVTLALMRHWAPFRYVRRSRLRTALWRTVLYWIVTLLRLLYMLISMTFHVGLILVLVSALSVGQFGIEYIGEQPPSPNFEHAYRLDSDPLLHPASSPTSLDKPQHPPSTRPRAKSRCKPSSIFIHPNDSNIARADAVAVEMGIHGDTDRVRGSNTYTDTRGTAWEHGKGRDVARDMMAGAKQHSRSGSRQALFRIQDADSEDDEELYDG